MTTQPPANPVLDTATHAVLELVERHGTSTLRAGGADHRHHVDLETVPNGPSRQVLGALRAADVDVEAAFIPNEFGIPIFTAWIWSPDFPTICAGAGCHPLADVALSRALTEAVQTRATQIAGTRDDIETAPAPLSMTRPNFAVGGGSWSWSDVPSLAVPDTDRALLRMIATLVAKGTGHDPVVVDLSTRSDFAVVRVVAPGLRHPDRGVVPR